MKNDMGWTLVAICGLSICGVGCIVLLTLAQPGGDNTRVLALIIGFLAPTIAALIGIVKSIQNGNAIAELKKAVNSRLSQLLDQTALAARYSERILTQEGIPPSITPTPENIIERKSELPPGLLK